MCHTDVLHGEGTPNVAGLEAIAAVRCVHDFSHLSNFQKAGFLYVEESFSKSDRVFRRRVVLAVS